MKDKEMKTPKSKKNKQSLIQEILSRIKTEVNSNDDQSSEETASTKRKENKKVREGTPSNNILDPTSIISQLVKQESETLRKKKKRKSLNDSNNSEEPKLKKVKLENVVKQEVNLDDSGFSRMTNSHGESSTLSHYNSEKEVPVSKPLQIKSEESKAKRKPQLKLNRNNVKQEDSDSSTKNKITIKNIKQESTSFEKVKGTKASKNIHTTNENIIFKRDRGTEESDDEDDFEVMVPKPIIVKVENSGSNESSSGDSDIETNKKLSKSIQNSNEFVYQKSGDKKSKHQGVSNPKIVSTNDSPNELSKDNAKGLKYVIGNKRKRGSSDDDTSEDIVTPQSLSRDIEKNKNMHKTKKVEVPKPKPVIKKEETDSGDSSEENDGLSELLQGKSSLNMEKYDKNKLQGKDKSKKVPRPLIIKKEMSSNESSDDQDLIDNRISNQQVSKPKISKNQKVPKPKLAIKKEETNSDDSSAENDGLSKLLQGKSDLNMKQQNKNKSHSKDKSKKVPKLLIIKKENTSSESSDESDDQDLSKSKNNQIEKRVSNQQISKPKISKNQIVPKPKLVSTKEESDSDDSTEESDGLSELLQEKSILNMEKQNKNKSPGKDMSKNVPKPIILKKENIGSESSDESDDQDLSESKNNQIEKRISNQQESKSKITENQKVPKPKLVITKEESDSDDSTEENDGLNEVLQGKSGLSMEKHDQNKLPGKDRSKQVPKPLILKKGNSESSDEDLSDNHIEKKISNQQVSKPKTTKIQKVPKPKPVITNEESDSDDSSEESDQDLPKPNNQIEKRISNQQVSKHKITKTQKVPKPMKKEESDSDDSSEENDGLSELLQAKSRLNMEKHDQNKLPTKGKSKQVPKPIILKKENSGSETSDHTQKMFNNQKVPKPKITKKEGSSSESSDESEDQDITRSNKQIEKRLSYQQVPKPKMDNSDSESNDESEEDKTTPRKISNQIKKMVSSQVNSTPKNGSRHSGDRDITNSIKSNSPVKNIRDKQKRKRNVGVEDTKQESNYGESSDEELPKPIKEEPLKLNGIIKQEPDEISLTPKTWQQRLQVRYPHLEEQNYNINVPESDTDYFILRIPKNIDVSLLLNKKIKLNKDSEITLNDQQYTFEPKQTDPMIVNLQKSKLVNIDKEITLQRSLKEEPLRLLKATDREDVLLPETIKSRHPLFGAMYKDKVKIEKDIKLKVTEAEENKKKQLLKKKKKIKSEVSSCDSVLDMFASEAFFSTPTVKNREEKIEHSKKKKKKSKHNDSDEILSQIKSEFNMSHSQESLDDSGLSLKHKHKSKKRKKLEMD
ncbi:nucleolar protein dao-5-like [Sitophilus oryzae]|uniref:Nucleolar protein dao-5-like n=1 Tax=Sitophilus oryzae TaxID=7048 RepID=A0A6J2Y761_SITOR|nr:nucleolar protein dao-5-like [Sitophilus oryzae]